MHRPVLLTVLRLLGVTLAPGSGAVAEKPISIKDVTNDQGTLKHSHPDTCTAERGLSITIGS